MHAHEHEHRHERLHASVSLNRTALSATAHCLAGCAIGEVLGMVVATAFDLGNALSILVAVVLAFTFGYSLTMLPLLRSGLPLATVLPLGLASDTLSIGTMEVADNAFILVVPGALDAGLGDALFWWSLGVSLIIAFLAAFPVNRYLIARGRGHAVVHAHRHS
jgi:hypothetical protein